MSVLQIAGRGEEGESFMLRLRIRHALRRRPSTAKRVVLMAATCTFLGAAVAPAQSTIDAHWLQAVDNFWWTPSAWSSAPHFPNNNFPPGTSYNAFIDVAGSPYKVTLGGQGYALNNLTLDSPDATLLQDSGSST